MPIQPNKPINPINSPTHKLTNSPMTKDYIVLARNNGTTKNNAPFANIRVANLEETINVTIWDCGPQQEPQVGRVLAFYTLRDNGGKKSCNITDTRLDPNMPTESHPLYNLLPRPIKQDVWQNTINDLLALCSDKQLMDVISDFSGILYKPYSEYPAATSVHHAFPGGLLNHTHQMLAMLLGIYPTLPAKVKIERCILAIMFHDYGKVYEYNHAGEPQSDMYLLGHIYIGAHKLHQELERRKVDDAETKRIVHCVLAHHGKREFGSPVLPCNEEAELVSKLDDLSAKADHISGIGNMEKSFILETSVVKG